MSPAWLLVLPPAGLAIRAWWPRRRPDLAPMPPVVDARSDFTTRLTGGEEDLKANPTLSAGFVHDFHCTHNPCRCDGQIVEGGVTDSPIAPALPSTLRPFNWADDDGPEAA